MAHESRLADPFGETAEEAEVRLDCRRGELFALPNRHHGSDVALAQVTRIGQRLEARLVLQVTKESPQEVRAFFARLERHFLVPGGVLLVKEVNEGFDDLERRCLA